MTQRENTHDVVHQAPKEPAGPEGPVRGTRVDAAHVRADDVASSHECPFETQPPALPGDRATEKPAKSHKPHPGDRDADGSPNDSVPAEPTAAITIEQVRLQASQLAGHLQRQATSVDHREAELNARLAAMEHQIRGARLWLSEQHLELGERKAELDRRERELSQREARLEGNAPPPRHRAVTIGNAMPEELQLAERAAELDRRQAELDEMASRLAQQLAAGRQFADAERALAALDEQHKNLERAEQLLAIEQEDLERARKLLADERAQFTEDVAAERQRQSEHESRVAAEQARVRADLKRQSDELASRLAVLEQMKADISRSQQEVLEIRLATEELWSQLCGTMAPAALSRSLAQIRLKLAQEQRLARSELEQQKSELQTLGARLAEQHHALTRRREEWQAWVRDRQTELERQAGQLAQREAQLAEQECEFKQAREAWDSERFRLRQEIRRLLRERDRVASAAA